MFQWKKESRRALCALLTAAMLCSDAGVTAFAAEQGILTDITDEAPQEEARAEEEQGTESSTGKSQEEPSPAGEDSRTGQHVSGDSQTEEPSAGDSQTEEVKKEETEGTLPEDGRPEDAAPEETPKEETTGENPGGGDAETGISEEKPAEENTAPEKKPDAEETETNGDVSTEKSVSGNDADGEKSVSGNDVVVEESLLTADGAGADGEIASGTSGDIKWAIDAEGKLTVTGTGNFGSYWPAWNNYMDQIKTAEIKVTGATNATHLFFGCTNLTSVDLSGFDTNQVTDMSEMFYKCSSLTSVDLSSFDTSQVTDMSRMFDDCSKLSSVNISGWDTGNVTNMYSMFLRCSSLTSVDVSGFNTSQVTKMSSMFEYCSSLASLDVSNFNTSQVTSMSDMFHGCSALASVDVSKFDTSQVTDMAGMFSDCSALTSVDVSKFDTSKVTNMDSMFHGCSGLISLDVSGFNTSKVTNMGIMFHGCSGLTSLDLNSFDTSQVTSMYRMFSDCSSLTSVGVSGFDTSQVTYMHLMFLGCSGLTSLDVSSFDTSQVISMSGMFSGCSGLTSLDVSSFDTSQVTDMRDMFSGCSGLKSLDLSSFDVSQATSWSIGEQLLDGCNRLQEIHTPRNLKVSVDLPSGTTGINIWRQADDGTTYKQLPRNLDQSILIRRDVGLYVHKDKTYYMCGETLTLDDITVEYYNADGELQKTESGYTTNGSEIDMSVAGKKTLIISYSVGGSVLTGEIELTVINQGKNIASGSYQENGSDLTWVIDQNGKLVVAGTGDFTAPSHSEESVPWYAYREQIKTAEVNVKGMTDASYMFSGCSNLTSVDVSAFDTSKVTDMGRMFLGCSALESLDLSGFDTGLVSDMDRMFLDCSNLKSLDVSSFNTGLARDMRYMFSDCSNLESLDVSSFDTRWVGDMEGMFSGCSGLKSLDVCNFDTSSVRHMSSMFSDCSGLKNLDLSSFDTSEVRYMRYMFDRCSDLLSLDLGSFDASQVTDMEDIFRNCGELQTLRTPYKLTLSVALPEGIWYQPDGTQITALPQGQDTGMLISKREKPVYSAVIASKTKVIYGCNDTVNTDDLTVFYYDAKGMAYKLTDSDYETNAAVIDMSTAGKKEFIITYHVDENVITCPLELTVKADGIIAEGKNNNITWSIDASGKLLVEGEGDYSGLAPWYNDRVSVRSVKVNVTGIKDISSMFGDCSSLTSVDLSGLNTSNVTDMGWLFYGCSSLTSLDLSGLNTSNVTNMGGMFSGCSSLASLDVSGFDTGKVIDMYHMFSSCSGLVSLDLSKFDTSNVTDMGGMFEDCSSLVSLDVSGFDASQVTDAYGMISGCDSLQKINTPYNLTAYVSLPTGTWYQSDGTKITRLPQNLDHSIVITKGEPPKEIPIESITISEKSLSLKTGESKKLTVKVTPENATSPAITWASSDTKIAKVENGTVTAVAAGKCTITASAGDKEASCEVTVVSDTPTDPSDKIVLNAGNVTITLSDTAGYVYDNTPKTPEVTVSCTASGNAVTLEKDKDYTVAYENNVNAFEDSAALLTAQNAPRVVITGQNRYSGTVSQVFTIQKAAAPQAVECSANIKDYQAGQRYTLDLSGYFAAYQKIGYAAGTPAEDNTIAGNVITGQPSIDGNGILTYQTLAGTRGDFAVVPVTVSFLNHKDSTISVKIMLGNGPVEFVAAPAANPESGRQLAAGAKVTLSCGTAGAQIYYTTGASEKELAEPTETSTRYTEPIAIDSDMYIKAAAIKGDNRSKSVTFHYTVLVAADQVLKPYAVPGQGIVEKGTKVELKSDTPDAVIYYVTGKNPDMLGEVPDDDSNKYAAPIEINEDIVIKAFAEKDGMKDSDAAIFVYRVNTVINKPTAVPASGNVNQGSYISLTADGDANIYYTTDASDPAVSGTAKLYEAKIRVEGTAGSVITIKAAAEKKGIYSETVTYTYTVSENKEKGLRVMLAGGEEYTYTGRAITPAVIVSNNGEELTQGADYTVQYSNNVKAAEKSADKAPKITVTGKGNLTKKTSVTFTIKPKDIGDEEEVVGSSIVVVKGKTAAPVLFYGGVKLTTKDFDFVNPADAKKKYSEDGKLLIKGKGNFTGEREIAVKVVDEEDLKKLTVVVDNTALKKKPLVYDGEAKTLDGYFTVYDTQDKSKSNPLEKYSDYAVIYPENHIDAGKVKFTVVGLGAYSGTVTKTYTIKPRAVKKAEDGDMQVNVKDGAGYPFRNGGVTIPDLTVTCDGDVLIPGEDYKVTYSGNKKTCTDNKAKCTISFLGNYKGSTKLVRKFHITPAVLSDADQMNGTVRVVTGDKVYTGKPGVYKSVPYVTVNNALLKSSNYTVSYYKDPGMSQVIDGKTASVDLTGQDSQTVYVKIAGKGNYQGTFLTAQYNVGKLTGEAIDLSKAKVTFVGGNKVEYTGEGVEPAVEIQYKSGGQWKTVDAGDIGTSVKVTYINNVNKGKATVMVNGNGGKYVGNKTAVFNIKPKNMQ